MRPSLVAGLLAALATPVAAQLGEPLAAPAAVPQVVICSQHDRALAYWIGAARSGRLPRSGVTVVHIDAHPDLSLPRGPIPRAWPEDVGGFLARTNISSFQLAAVRAGLIDEIVWLRPDWSTQLADGSRSFQLGALADGALAVDEAEDYYVLDSGYAPTASLRDAQPVRLRVLSIEAAEHEKLLADGPTILDVDLDSFATLSPPAERLRRAGFSDADVDRLRAIFAPARLALALDPAARVAEVKDLTAAVGAVGRLEWTALPGALAVFWQRGIGARDLGALYGMISHAQGLALDTLLAEGREVVGLTERRADSGEIDDAVRRIRELLERGALSPALVTIARSVDDGFTPRDAWPGIEWRLLRALAAVYPRAAVHLDSGLEPAPSPAEGLPAMPAATERALPPTP